MGKPVKTLDEPMLVRHVFHCAICGLTQGLPERKHLVEMRVGHTCLPLTETMETRILAHALLRKIKPDHPAVIAERRRELLDSHRPQVIMTASGPTRRMPTGDGVKNPHRKGK